MESSIPEDTKCATETIANLLFQEVWPVIINIRKKFQKEGKLQQDEVERKLKDVFVLCCSQLNKCLQNLFEIFKLENRFGTVLQDSRNCTLERFSWCFDRLKVISTLLDKLGQGQDLEEEDAEQSFLVTPMYFVNWIDQTFEILSKLSNIIYKTDYQETENLYDIWKNEIVETVMELHASLDELLLSAMTLCRHCLPADQLVVKARCQVVLREAKALLTELVSGDIEATFQITKESLKLPLMPSNVNVLIDVLKDVLYVLETNTNTALLALLVNCFSNNMCPTEKLKQHLKSITNGLCSCIKKGQDVSEDCTFVKEFDLHNERLMQIGAFAVSCSSDQNRISCLRSGLASLEALDPYLVPALIMSSDSVHANLLVNNWQQEVEEIRDSIFLIVDPAAFVEKSKQLMHQTFLRVLEENRYSSETVCPIVNTGGVVYDFFDVYKRQEPDALTHQEKLLPLLADLKKAINEVKVVANLVSGEKELIYKNIKMPTKQKEPATFSKLLKRLKLLYTLINRINTLFHPKENDDLLFPNDNIEEEQQRVLKNLTHTIISQNKDTVAESPRKQINNMTRSIFARTGKTSSPANQFALKRLTKHLNSKKNEEINFSVQIDEIFDFSSKPEKSRINRFKETSILYSNYTPKKNKSLRKSVLNRNSKLPLELAKMVSKMEYDEPMAEDEDLFDTATSLQITEILDQMSDMTNIIDNRTARKPNSTRVVSQPTPRTKHSNVLAININESNPAVSKKLWNIPVNSSTVEVRLDETGTVGCNVSKSSSQRSDVTTLERLNDLDLVDDKLKKLKMIQRETSL